MEFAPKATPAVGVEGPVVLVVGRVVTLAVVLVVDRDVTTVVVEVGTAMLKGLALANSFVTKAERDHLPVPGIHWE